MREVGTALLVLTPWFQLVIYSLKDGPAREALGMGVGILLLYVLLCGLYSLFAPQKRVRRNLDKTL